MYNEKVIEHFTNPRNVGEIEDADGVGEVGSPQCGDIMKVFLKVEDNIIKDIKFKTFGCASAIASSSIMTEMVKGRTIEEALALTNKDVVDALGVFRRRRFTVPCWRSKQYGRPLKTTGQKRKK